MSKNRSNKSYFQLDETNSSEYFKCRDEIINKILRQVNKAKKGIAQHYFITGEKGIGKTSLAKYVQRLCKEDLIPAYVSNMENTSLNILVSNIFKSILENIPKKLLNDNTLSIFNIEGIEVNNLKLNFKPNENAQKDLVEEFPYYLKELTDKLDNKGIFLVIDDLNGLSKSDEFLNWYKRLADKLAVDDNYNIPIYFLLASYYESFQNMAIRNESFIRIFHYDNIEC